MHVRASVADYWLRVNRSKWIFADHDFFQGLVAPKGAVLKFYVLNGASSRPSWVAVRPVCWEEHRPDPRSLFNSSPFRTANCKCLGMILVFLLSRAAFQTNSRISALRYTSTAARYTGATAPTRSA